MSKCTIDANQRSEECIEISDHISDLFLISRIEDFEEEVSFYNGKIYITESKLNGLRNTFTLNPHPNFEVTEDGLNFSNGECVLKVGSFEEYFENTLWPTIQQGLKDDLYDFNSQGSNCNGTKRKGNVNFNIR